LARDGRFAFASNTGSNSITGYSVSSDGSLQRLRADGVSAHTGRAPADSAVTSDQRYIYCLNGGDGSISGFAINHDGSLTPVETQPGIPLGAAGLVAK
jgi:6-phosphogluconolactonase (cycloisomerase 2 family)